MIHRGTGEFERQQALDSYEVLDTDSETAYDELTEMVAKVCETPIALVSLIDGDRQWYKSKYGISLTENAREIAFCNHAICQDELFVVPDAHLDGRFQQNPLVVGKPGVRFYAGAQLIAPSGHALGTLCVIDFVPRELTASQRRCLEVSARQVMNLLELRRINRRLAAIIDERRRAEIMLEVHRLRMTEALKLKALGEMAGGLSHEINNPLAIIQGRAAHLREMAQNNALDDSTAAQYAEMILAVVVRIAKIVKGLRAFSRSGEHDPFELVSIKALIDDTLQFCTEKIRSNGISLSVDIEGDDHNVKCRSVQISQILLNLITNAFDAVEHLDDKWIAIAVRKQGQNVIMTVTDSGGGIPSLLHEKIFQPFFTTKAGNKGTGLGLRISKEIAETHGGSLALNNDSPNTQFVLSLPQHEDENPEGT